MDDRPEFTFKETALAQITCATGDCSDCIISDTCRDGNVTESLNWWMEYILRKLDKAGDTMKDVSSEEWDNILRGVI